MTDVSVNPWGGREKIKEEDMDKMGKQLAPKKLDGSLRVAYKTNYKHKNYYLVSFSFP